MSAKADSKTWPVQAVDPPILTESQWYFNWVVGAVLFIMAIMQLIGFTDFKDALKSYDLSGPAGWAAVLIIAELIAAVGFLRIKLSYGFRLFSAGLALLVAGFWFVETLQVFGNGNGLYVTNSGYFGKYLSQPSGWWSAIEAIIFLFWTVLAVELIRAGMAAVPVKASKPAVSATARSRSKSTKTPARKRR